MKKFSKILSVALLVALVLSLGITNAFAAGEGFNITVTSNTGHASDHVYKAYQVFAGDLVVNEDGTTVLSNITWGNGVDGPTILRQLKASTNTLFIGDDPLTATVEADATAVNIFTSCETAADVAAVLGTLADRGDAIAAVAKIIGANTTTAEEGLTGLDAGYYLIVDETEEEDVPDGDTYSDFMLEVVKSVTVTAKDSTTTTEKKVKDTNDTTGVTTTWQDSADHDIGDIIPFQLNATIASDYAKYDEYYFAFHDEEGDGLDFQEITAVYVTNIVDGEPVVTPIADTAYTLKESNFDDDCTFEVIFADLKDIDAVKAGSVLTVEYTSKLNDEAVIGSEGNPNEMYGEFSNNPNDEQRGKTAKDKVIVFTYQPIINKVDENQESLVGAGFTLYKEVSATITNGTVTPAGAMKGSDIIAALTTKNSSIECSQIDKDKYYIALAMKTIEDDESVFEFKGIDDGVYVLVETDIPAGYNAYASVTVTVSATHTNDDAQSPDVPLTLKSLSADKLFEANTENGELTGELEATIQNNKGTTLPSTGGIGTTIFYAVGGILVLAAIVLLITKKRMSD